MLKFINRNRKWLASKLDGELQREYPSNTKAREAELAVLEAVRNLGGEDWEVFHRKRVPRPDSHRSKGEIDVIAVGESAVLAIEVKNWKGTISIEDNLFFAFQGKQRPSQLRDRGKVANIISEKVSSLEWVFRAVNESRVDFAIFPLVVFTNDDCKLTEELSRRSDCWHLNELERMYQERVKDEQPMSPSSKDKMVELVSNLGSWDEAGYAGGKLLEADIADHSGILFLDGDPLEREVGMRIEIESTRGKLSTILMGPSIKATITDSSGTSRTTRLDPFCKLNLVLPTGRRRGIPVQQLRYLAYGHEGIEPWRHERNIRSEELETGSVTRSKDRAFFEEGKRLSGTARNWAEHGLWVNLDISGVDGLLPNNQFPNLEISKQIFVQEKEIPVIMNNISEKGIIYLRYDDDPD